MDMMYANCCWSLVHKYTSRSLDRNGSSDLREQPILEEEDSEKTESSSDEREVGNQLSASRNALDLSSHDIAVLPPGARDPAPESNRDNVDLLYATVPESHKVEKRGKMV